MANILAIAGPNSKYKQPGARLAGFWAGLWHGLMSPLTFLISLFSPGVRIYETQNRGRWYRLRFHHRRFGGIRRQRVASQLIP